MISHKDIQDVSYLRNKENQKVEYIFSRDVFWPFYLWRVSAPKEEAPLNIFQMLIIRLIRAGCNAIDKLGLYSNLDKELVRYILAQLTNDGYLTDWTLTKKALSLLDGDTGGESEKIGSYYLIQDATSGNLIPRVLSTLPFIENIDLTSNYPKFVKDRGKGKSISPLLIRDTQPANQPSAEQMSICLRTHRRALNQLKQADLVPESTVSTSNSIEFIEDSPICVFMYTRLFSTHGDNRLWYLSDPTGLTATLPELTESAEKLVEKNKLFAARVNEVIGIAEEGKVVGFNEQQQKFDEQAKIEMLSQFPWVQGYPVIERHLQGMLRLKLQVKSQQKPRFELIDGLLSEQQRVLEAWLKEVIAPHFKNTQWHVFIEQPNGDRSKFISDRKLLAEIYTRVNGVSVNVAYQLATVRPGSVKSALIYGTQSLKPLLAAALLKEPGIIETIEEEYPAWIDLIVELAKDRNEFASHAGGKIIQKETVMKHITSVETLLTVLEKILGSK